MAGRLKETALAAGYRVRAAREADLARLPALERAAAHLFTDAGLEGDYLAETLPLEALREGLEAGFLFVAEAGDGTPVGFALARPLDGELYLVELDVHPDHGRRGLGRALVEAVLARARTAGYPSVSLVTFRDLPWNAPFYERLGFRPLARDAVGPALRAVLEDEARRGLPSERRTAMRARA